MVFLRVLYPSRIGIWSVKNYERRFDRSTFIFNLEFIDKKFRKYKISETMG